MIEVGENLYSKVILMIEDNPGNACLMEQVLKESSFPHRFFLAEDGEEAMDFLGQKHKYSQRPCPDLIILDLNLPKRDGYEVLSDIKSDPDLKHIPVVILASESSGQNIRNVYDMHANCYISKPDNLFEFVKVVKSLIDFWFDTVKLAPSGIFEA